MTSIDPEIAPNGRTLASSVYERLRADVLSSRFAPGEKLRVLALAEAYEAGASPVREALNRLAAEGMVDQVDQRGFRVPEVSVDDLAELTQTRCLMNEVALRESIARGGREWEEGIVLALHYLTHAPLRMEKGKRATTPEWEARHREFHQALIAACGSRWILSFCQTLFDLADRYRHLWVAVDTSGRDVKAEHQAIAESVLARDPDEAIKRMNAHIQLTASAIAASQDHGRSSTRSSTRKSTRSKKSR